TLALVGAHALPAIETSPQRYVLNNSQQMGIGISMTVGEYQSVSRMPQMPSRQSFGQFVIDADVALFAILNLPIISFPFAVNFHFFGSQVDVRPLHMRPFPVPKIDSKEEFKDIGFIYVGKLQQMCQHFGIV